MYYIIIGDTGTYYKVGNYNFIYNVYDMLYTLYNI